MVRNDKLRSILYKELSKEDSGHDILLIKFRAPHRFWLALDTFKCKNFGVFNIGICEFEL
jgi:hypothetical protein